MERDAVLIDLALQGGGSHGAFTWGVLDRLLEEKWLTIAAISGTSAGAMNAAVLVDGWTAGGAEGARAALDQYWRRVSQAAAFSPMQRSLFDRLMGRWTLDTSPAYIFTDLMSRVLSPYDLNPTGYNPLRKVLAESIDFERLAGSPIKLFITATSVPDRTRPDLPECGDHRRRAAGIGLPADHVPRDRDRWGALLGWRLCRQPDDHAAGA